MKLKVLINSPSFKIPGGVANHYKGLQRYWSYDIIQNTIGSRAGIPGIILLPIDVLKFVFKCIFIRPNLVVLNPSLLDKSLLREAVYLKISSFLGIKTIVFFHGWKEEQADIITKNPKWFVTNYQKAATILVLANSFKEQLLHWGITKPILLTTTKVDNALLGEFDLKTKTYGKNLLFLARVEVEKGILITIEAYKTIKEHYPEATLTIVGDGKGMAQAKALVADYQLADVVFKGNIHRKALAEAFLQSDLYLLPTVREGMPTSVLEAMTFGLPVISRPTGGLVDFFENDNMGYLIESFDAVDYSDACLKIFNNEASLETIGAYNHHYAKQHFMASEVAQKLETLFLQAYTAS